MPTTDDQRVTDQRSPYERVAADLRDEILSGTVHPGTALSWDGLRHRFGVPPDELGRALEVLRGEGLVSGGTGGTPEMPEMTVLGHRQRTMRPSRSVAPAAPGEPYRWVTEARRRGVRARSSILDVTVVEPAPVPVARALELPEDGPVVLRSQLLTFDDEPAGLVKSYFPPEIARGTALMERLRIRGGTPTLLARLGHPPRRCVDSVSARVPTQEQHALLRLPDGTPVLRTFRVVYSDGDRPVEVNDTVEAGHLYELQYEFTQAP
ncbi:GntR family transcriptional regulator [Streptomyces cinnamoneus]|uniref:UbiC transcription regulator-associated domain-containing protein n=1 Tax=Streptomyces cinnamoneus TaxID=53446 RepID=A0A918WFR8_STRCJ|nr:GntR family transcriptional regulator [Streptomyces cinnamoneus]GHC39918.1 hypothetical protein GCM10010507_12380 [Streptomyces cinnamoneus]